MSLTGTVLFAELGSHLGSHFTYQRRLSACANNMRLLATQPLFICHRAITSECMYAGAIEFIEKLTLADSEEMDVLYELKKMRKENKELKNTIINTEVNNMKIREEDQRSEDLWRKKVLHELKAIKNIREPSEKAHCACQVGAHDINKMDNNLKTLEEQQGCILQDTKDIKTEIDKLKESFEQNEFVKQKLQEIVEREERAWKKRRQEAAFNDGASTSQASANRRNEDQSSDQSDDDTEEEARPYEPRPKRAKVDTTSDSDVFVIDSDDESESEERSVAVDSADD